MAAAERRDLWRSLLSDERLYGLPYPADESSPSQFEKDYARIVFSSAFRRLQDKTQVFPLSHTDFTRTRLTHSLEVSAVGRNLGVLAAKHLKRLGVECEREDVGAIVATASLAHDIGNPPFGHSGEAAIQAWAMRKLRDIEQSHGPTLPPIRARRLNAQSIPMRLDELADFQCFEGNAQGFRILVRTGARTRKGGLRLTVATLGAMTKYPRPSATEGYAFDPKKVSQKKHGYVRHDALMATRAFRRAGMVESHPGIFSRHPLAFLTEAADDICYAIADIEDGVKVGVVTFDEAREVLLPIASVAPGFDEWMFLDRHSRLARIRAAALGVLVSQCAEAFRESLSEMEAGALEVPLLDRTSLPHAYQAIKALAKRKVYRHERVLQIEYAAYQTIGGLLDMFYAALCESQDERKEEKLRKMFPHDFLWKPGRKVGSASEHDDPVSFLLPFMTRYERLLAVTDYISGMTDRFAVQLFQRLSGIRLPD